MELYHYRRKRYYTDISSAKEQPNDVTQRCEASSEKLTASSKMLSDNARIFMNIIDTFSTTGEFNSDDVSYPEAWL